jgi:hypothetical protein
MTAADDISKRALARERLNGFKKLKKITFYWHSYINPTSSVRVCPIPSGDERPFLHTTAPAFCGPRRKTGLSRQLYMEMMIDQQQHNINAGKDHKCLRRSQNIR